MSEASKLRAVVYMGAPSPFFVVYRLCGFGSTEIAVIGDRLCPESQAHDHYGPLFPGPTLPTLEPHEPDNPDTRVRQDPLPRSPDSPPGAGGRDPGRVGKD